MRGKFHVRRLIFFWQQRLPLMVGENPKGSQIFYTVSSNTDREMMMMTAVIEVSERKRFSTGIISENILVPSMKLASFKTASKWVILKSVYASNKCKNEDALTRNWIISWVSFNREAWAVSRNQLRKKQRKEEDEEDVEEVTQRKELWYFALPHIQDVHIYIILPGHPSVTLPSFLFSLSIAFPSGPVVVVVTGAASLFPVGCATRVTERTR